MSKKITYLASVCLMLVSVGGASAAISITTEDGRGADTYLSNDSQSGIGTNGPDATHGAEVRMRAFRQLTDARSKAGYIRFDLAGIGGDTSGATLTFDATYLKGSAKTVQVYGLIDGDGDFWDESTITYNTAVGVIPNPPTTLGNCVLDTAEVTLLGTIATPAAGDPYPVRFSSNPTDLPLADFLNADGNGLVTFLFIGTDNEGEIASKEHETFNPPTLDLPNAFICPPAPTIMWISDNKGFGDIEPNTPGDQGWVDLLTQQGYEVIYKNQNEYIDGEQYWRTLDPNKTAELEAVDLIILSRNADSGSYSSVADNEPNQWNAVTTPLIGLSAHMSRSNKWGWANSTGTTYTKDGKINVVDPTSVIFAGVVADTNDQVETYSAQWNMDWVTGATDAGNGKVLATRSTDGLVSIATWEAGQEYYDGGAVAGGPRMLFIAGTGSKNSGDNYAPDGMYNLTADGETMFLNAVAYMLKKNIKIVWVSDNLGYDFEAGRPADQGFIDLLTAPGYTVDYKGQFDPHEPGNDEVPVNPEWTYWRELDPNKIAELNAADLVIIARDCASGTYDDGNEPLEWNSITTPMLMQSGHLARTGKWSWLNTGGTARSKDPNAVVIDALHPLFDGVNIAANGQVAVQSDEWNVDWANSNDVGNGTLLAVRPDGVVWIATWEAGQEYFEGSGQIAGGPRMLFISGSGGSNPIEDGTNNLTADGELMFLNAVVYMLGK